LGYQNCAQHIPSENSVALNYKDNEAKTLSSSSNIKSYSNFQTYKIAQEDGRDLSFSEIRGPNNVSAIKISVGDAGKYQPVRLKLPLSDGEVIGEICLDNSICDRDQVQMFIDSFSTPQASVDVTNLGGGAVISNNKTQECISLTPNEFKAANDSRVM
jgi:hypothetical protein